MSQATKFACTQCSKSFARKDYIVRHIASVHLQHKHHTCSHCDKSFADKTNLAQHIANVHQLRKTFQCNECDKAFSTSSKLKRHTQAVHLKQRQYACDECQLSFMQKEHLTVHRDVIHLHKRQFQCHKCNKVFGSKANLARHLKQQKLGSCDQRSLTYEQQIQQALENNNIPFVAHKPILMSSLPHQKINYYKCDLYLEVAKHLVIIEVDERQHKWNNASVGKLPKFGYTVHAEQTRMLDISTVLNSMVPDKKVLFVRFNPHSYSVDNAQATRPMTNRLEHLVHLVQNYVPECELEVQYMYYDCVTHNGELKCSIWSHPDYTEEMKQHLLDPIAYLSVYLRKAYKSKAIICSLAIF